MNEWYKQLKEINRKPKSVIYADNFLPEKEGIRDSAKLPASVSSSILLPFHRSLGLPQQLQPSGDFCNCK